MELMDSPTGEKDIELDDAVGLAKEPTQSVIYLYGRSANTPLDQVTPVDILEDVLGIDASAALLDTEGVRTYRHADQWVPYKDPRVATKILSWVRRRARPGGQERIDGVCSDILLSLQGLDSRRKEYESFAARLEEMARRDASPTQPNVAPKFVGEMIAQLRALPGAERVTPMADVTKCVEAFRSGATRVDALSGCVRGALAERLQVLSAYRSFAKRVRVEAGLSLARSPASHDECERIRDLAGQVLRRRYYLEADWLGEEPLGGPEVSYEQAADL
jgi:hypothetical protein